MKITAIIQARMNSTRLRGKILLPLKGKPMLTHVYERIAQMKNIDGVVIATTDTEEDDPVVHLAESCGFNWFRGSENDVLSRYYHAAVEKSSDVIVRFTADCPLIDPQVADRVVTAFINYPCDISTNAGDYLSQRTFPRGLDTEVFTLQILKEAFNNATQSYQREHVTPYMYEHGKAFYYKNDIDYSNFRLTVDTKDDYELVQAIYGKLYHGVHNFYLSEIVDTLKANPEMNKINADVEQKKYAPW